MNKKAIMIVILILLVLFVPKKMSTCSGQILCFGVIHEQTTKQVWLNTKTSVLEIQNETVRSCVGSSFKLTSIFDGCTGNWGSFESMRVDCQRVIQQCSTCQQELGYCDRPDDFRKGITCSQLQSHSYEELCKDREKFTNNLTLSGIRCFEWKRACQEVYTTGRTPIIIESMNETGIN